MTNKYMKKCSTTLAIKEMQVKTTLEDSVPPQSDWPLSRKQGTTNAGKDAGEKGTLVET
jgi:hypothetical protein